MQTSRDLTSQEAADILKLSKHTVIRMHKNGKLKAWRTPGGHLRFRQDQIEEYAEQMHQPNVPVLQ